MGEDGTVLPRCEEEGPMMEAECRLEMEFCRVRPLREEVDMALWSPCLTLPKMETLALDLIEAVSLPLTALVR